MKKIVYVLLYYLYSATWLVGQQFEFPLYFKDAAGHLDTIVLGVDYKAHSGVDSIFNEMNIISHPFKEGLDVRVTDEFYAYWTNMPASFHVKREISNGIYPPITVDIRTNDFPVTAYWDKTLFDNATWEGSLFTSFNPGGWWDVGGSGSNLGVIFFKDLDSISFTSNIKNDRVEHYGYIKGTDSIPVYWVALGPKGIGVGTREESNSSLKLTPNPTCDFFKIEGFGNPVTGEIEIWTLQGTLCSKSKYNPEIGVNVSTLLPGTYLCRIRDGETVRCMRLLIF